MIKALIFDLDNCLAAATELGEDLYEPAFCAMRNANDGGLSEEKLRQAFAEIWRHPLDWVATEHGFSEAMLAAGWKVFASMESQRPMQGYADLPILAQLPGLRFLVTSGFRRLQESKIKMLGLAPAFTAVFVDAIDEGDRAGKEGLFRQILETHGLKPEEVLVIGDSAHSEIAAGNRLGISTVQILRPGVLRGGNATYYIESLAELPEILAR